MELENNLRQQIAMVEQFIAAHWMLASQQAQGLSIDRADFDRILLGGCGDSHHAAIGLAFAFGTFTGLSVSAMESMSLARYAPAMASKSLGSCLVIGISNSGEVARTIEALEVWREMGAKTLAFTSNADSTLARLAEYALILPAPDLAHGPGLLSYIGSLLLGYATLVKGLLGTEGHRLNERITQLPKLLEAWVPAQVAQADEFARRVADGVGVFLGSGPAHGSARFGAAKVLEAAGERCWAQDVEEWAHLEYFCEPAYMPTILVSARGRARSRESEIIEAMRILGRSVLISEWMGADDWTALEREALCPLALWAAPSAYAATRAELTSAQPFRGFSGGRDRREGGGASRIRSSKRIDPGTFLNNIEKTGQP